MNTQAPITAETRMVPIEELFIDPINPRQEEAEAEINAMAESIAINGMMQNLSGLAHENGIGIVAGGRRLRALKLLQSEGWRRKIDQIAYDLVPVRVTDDPFMARSWSLTENVTHEPLHPSDEIRAYRAMLDQGSSPEMIASAFAKTAIHVKRRLKLAALPDAALDALKSGRMTLDTAQALTLAQDEARLTSVMEQAIARGPDRWTTEFVHRELTSGSIQSTDRRARFVGLVRYQAEGGTITDDLFADAAILHDEKLLDRVFNEKLLAEVEKLRKTDEWAWIEHAADAYVDYDRTAKMEKVYRVEVELPEADLDRMEELSELAEADVLDEEGQAELEELETRQRGDYSDEDRANAGIILYVNHTGELAQSGPWLKPDPANTANGDGVETSGGTAKPVMPDNCREDLTRIRLAALQAALLDKPEMLLDLLAYQFSLDAPAYRGAFAVDPGHPPITPSVESGTHIDARLSAIGQGDHTGSMSLEGLAAFTAKGKKHRNQIIAANLARAVNSFLMNGFIKELEADISPELRKTWTPDAANFFGRVRTDYLDRIWAEMLDLEPDDPRRDEFAKLKKGEKARELDGLFNDLSVREALGLSRDQNARIDAWLPEEMQK